MAAAAASGRPPECAFEGRRAGARRPTIWEAARLPELQRYCDLVARAHAQLPTSPEAARRSAELADQVLPDRAAPAVVLARVALAVGALDDAARAFARARSLDPRSVEDPAAMHDLAEVLRKTGKPEEALAVYRALVPRIDLFSEASRQVLVLLEAAHLSMIAANGAEGGLREAVAYLREAQQRPATRHAGDVMLSLVLVLDRAGTKEHADAALGEAQRQGAGTSPGPLDYLASSEDARALAALGKEASDRAAAIAEWRAFLAGPSGQGAWASAARKRLDALLEAPTSGARPRGGTRR